jgi:hypothetical protein
MKRHAVGAVLAATMYILIAPQAAAKGPGGSADTCPPGYTSMTLSAILAQAERLGVPEESARGMFANVNKNGDAWICQRKLPGEATDINFIDNQAVGLDRNR